MMDVWPNSEIKMPISPSIMLKKFYANGYHNLSEKLFYL